jgi:hypothetical protein
MTVMIKTIARPRIILVLLASIAVTGLGFVVFRSVLQDHTTYASGFSRAKFALVCAGLSEARAKMFLGPPLSEEIGPFGEVWYYSSQWPRSFSRDMARGLIVTFRLDGKVADTLGAPQAVARVELDPGESAADVLREAGLPIRVEPAYYKKAWYSRPRNDSGRYSLVAVLYDHSGNVVGTETGWEFD